MNLPLMQLKLSIYILTIVSLSVIGCGPGKNTNTPPNVSNQNSEEEFWFNFYKIDNKIKVFVNGSQIFDSENNGIAKHKDIILKISDYLKRGQKNQVTVELYNGTKINDSYVSGDKNWEISYELFNFKVPIDYVHEKMDDGALGMVYSNEHVIDLSK